MKRIMVCQLTSIFMLLRMKKVDGVGANIKRDARKASLQLSSKCHISTPQDLYNWAKSFCKGTVVFFSSKESYEETATKL